MNFLYIGAGGAIGAIMRYLISGWAYSLLGQGFPWGTLVVNLIGAFLIGFLWQLFEFVSLSPAMRNLIFIGGLGAFTTFSTFAFESLNLLRDGQIGLGLLNIVAMDLLGVVVAFGGIVLGRLAVMALR